jgi:hypothetical protein
MTIDVNSDEAVGLTEISQDLDLPPELEDRQNMFDSRSVREASRAEKTLRDRLDDQTIIRRFARGKKRLVVNQNLRIDYAHNSLQLSTPTGDLIAIHKISERLHYILIKKDSKYSKMIQEIISDCQFIPIDTATAERGFMRYQKYEIPQGYTLAYEPADVLWHTWQANQHQDPIGLQLDILILARSKWYRVQQMVCTDDRLDVQTRLGLISLTRRDRIAWIAKLGNVAKIVNADLNTTKNAANEGTDSDILGKIISKLAIEGSIQSDLPFDLPFDPNATMSQSGFHRPQNSALLYEEDRSSTLTGQTLTPISAQLMANALDVLEEYLEHGETIVRTEIIQDPQGNPISEKTVTTHRGCPRWAIEAIINWK